MKYISLIITCLVCTTSFSQSFPTNAINVSDSASKKIVIKYATNRNGKVITVSYLQKESTTSEELLIREAKLMTLKARPVIYTPEGFRRYGSYVFFFTATGKLLVYFQNSSMTLRGKAKNTNTGFSSPKGFPLTDRTTLMCLLFVGIPYSYNLSRSGSFSQSATSNSCCFPLLIGCSYQTT